MGARAAAAGAPWVRAPLRTGTRPGPRTGPRFRRDLNLQAARLRSIDDLPGPSWPTTLFWLFGRGYAEKGHLLQILQKSLYGPIWRSRFGPFDIVNVASPELIAQVIQQEGRFPVRVELPHWKEYRDLRGQAYGLHVESGPEWQRLRSVLNPRMLRLREAAAFGPELQKVVGDLLRRVEILRLQSPDGATVPDLAAELYKFGFEGISSILFETRLGCLQEQIPPDTRRFIGAVGDMLRLSDTVLILPRWTRRLLPYWGRFVQAWDDLYEVAQTLIDRRMAEIEAQVLSGGAAEGLYLTHLLASDRLSRAEVNISVTELMLGGVDTTSNTLSWALYRLARDGRVQERLHGEVASVCPGRLEPGTEQLARMPYLKAVIRETLRLYPVVHGNGRLISENEVIVDNYLFPKKTQFHLCHYAASHDPAQFERPEEFLPERWLRGGGDTAGGGGATAGGGGASPRATPGLYPHHPYSSIPFGVGVRGCVGKRVAEMEMFFALSRLVQHYRVEPEDGAPPVEPKTRTLLIPSRPINLRFLPRA